MPGENMIEIGISPVAFAIGSIEIRWYGLMMATGVTVLILWTLWQVRRGARLTSDQVLGAALVGIPSGIVFARLLHIIDYWKDYYPPSLTWFGGAGLTIYGAILGAALGVWVYSRFVKFNYANAADVVTPGIILAQCLGRIGCLFNGCCYGNEAKDVFCSIVYTNPLSLGFEYGKPVYPTQVYEIIFLLFTFIIIMLFRSRFKPDGMQFMFYLTLYSLWRIGVGFLRDNRPFLFGLEQAQVIGIIVCVVTIPLMIYQLRKLKTSAAHNETADKTTTESE
jgi:phosphatidylglycerol:prolipoprotein diacylglycerol transferase